MPESEHGDIATGLRQDTNLQPDPITNLCRHFNVTPDNPGTITLIVDTQGEVWFSITRPPNGELPTEVAERIADQAADPSTWVTPTARRPRTDV